MRASRVGTWLTAATLVVLALGATGCGCVDDYVGNTIVDPGRPIAKAQIAKDIPAAPVRPRLDGGPAKVDVMFVLDDGFSMTRRVKLPGETIPAGQILGDPERRIKTDVAQQIFADTIAKLKARLVADGVGTPDQLDLAFGVSRFEDYANFARGGAAQGAPLLPRSPVDGLARPFILNQPLLRETHQLFATLIQAALQRETPGDGGNQPFDAQSALEALKQLAVGDGFDGNGNGSRTESGVAGAVSTQITPGTSGDVPAFTFTADGNDRDGQPQYTVGETISSGTIGGAGWRPDSIRMIVIVSDTCTITPLLRDQNLAVDPVANNIQGIVVNTPSDPAAPASQGEQAIERFGWNDDVFVAPPNAATLQGTIQALNEKDIEVLSIGVGDLILPAPNKPNLPPPPQTGEYPAIQDPQFPNALPYTWMSAVAILSGARDPNLVNEVPDSRWVEGLPLVYKIDTLSPDTATILGDLNADLSDRIAEWMPYKATGTPPDFDPGSTFYDVTIDATNANPDLQLTLFALPGQNPGGIPPIYLFTSPDNRTMRIRVPNYAVGTVPSIAAVRVAWEVQISRANQTSTDELQTVLPINITPVFSSAADVGGANPSGNADPASFPAQPPAATSGTVAMVLPEIVGDATTQAPGTSTLTAVTSDAAYFRDLEFQIPAGTSIATMAGPFPPQALPYPAAGDR